MKTPEIPLTQDLVLVGGGHAHALVLRKWSMNPLPGARLTVINPGPTAPYTGMLPGHIAGHYSRDTLEIDLVRLCRFAGARLILAHATDIDRKARQIIVEGQGPIAYDVGSIDIGITAQMDIPGFSDHAVGAKPLDIYARRWRAFLDAVKTGSVAPKIAIIGGGVAGCELSLAMAHALQQSGSPAQVTVIEAGPQISGVGGRARHRLLQAMHDAGVTLRINATVEKIEAGQVILGSQDPVQSSFTVGAAGAFPHAWVYRNHPRPVRQGRPQPVCRGRLRHDAFCSASQSGRFRCSRGTRFTPQFACRPDWWSAKNLQAAKELPQTDLAWWKIGDGRKIWPRFFRSPAVALERPHRPDLYGEAWQLARDACCDHSR